MSKVDGATCVGCGRSVNVRPCPYCGGNKMRFGRENVEPHVPVMDFLHRIHEGVRHKRNYYAILGVVVIASFEGFVVLSSSSASIVTIHALLSFSNMVAGYFAIVRNENRLISHFRRLQTKQTTPSQDDRTSPERICNNCGHRFIELPCPHCNARDARIISIINEIEGIHENTTRVKENHFTKINFLGLGFFVLIVGLQWFWSYLNGSTTSLVISGLFAFILFIPAYYMFLESKFKDEEVLT